MKKTKENRHYRQGDVLVEQVSLFPPKLKPIAREGGRVILAHGQVTGHSHAISDPGTELMQAETGEQFLKIKGSPIKARAAIEKRWHKQVLVRLPKLGLVQFAEDDVTVGAAGRVLIDGDFALLTHDEHHAHALPAGNYRNIRQSEYHPEEIRRVQD